MLILFSYYSHNNSHALEIPWTFSLVLTLKMNFLKYFPIFFLKFVQLQIHALAKNFCDWRSHHSRIFPCRVAEDPSPRTDSSSKLVCAHFQHKKLSTKFRRKSRVRPFYKFGRAPTCKTFQAVLHCGNTFRLFVDLTLGAIYQDFPPIKITLTSNRDKFTRISAYNKLLDQKTNLDTFHSKTPKKCSLHLILCQYYKTTFNPR